MNCSKVSPFTNIKIRRKWLFSSWRGREGDRDRRTAKAAVVRKRQRDWGGEQREGGPGDTAGSQADIKSLDFLIFQHTCCNFHCCFLRTPMNFHRLRVRLTSNETWGPRPRPARPLSLLLDSSESPGNQVLEAENETRLPEFWRLRDVLSNYKPVWRDTAEGEFNLHVTDVPWQCKNGRSSWHGSTKLVLRLW